MKFGVRECANIVFRAKQPIRIGTATFQTGQPVLYIDTATTSSMEQATTTVYAQGGRGNARLLAWEGEKTLTFSFTDALLSPVGFAILSGAGLFKRGNGIDSSEETTINEDLVHFHMTSGANLSINSTTGTIDLRDAISEFGSAASICVDDAPIYIMETEDDGSLTGRIYSGEISVSGGIITITGVKLDGQTATKDAAVMVDYYVDLPGKHVYEADITPETFGGNYYVEADTLFRDQYTGKDLPANLTFPNVRLQSSFTMTFAGTGDPSTFDFTMDAFPGYTYFDKKKKVLCALQIVDSIALGAASAASKEEDPVMYHDSVAQFADAGARDSNVTDEEAGANVKEFNWKDGTSGNTKNYVFINLKDAVDFADLVTALDEDGNEIDMNTLVPRYVVSGNTGGYISISADGHIVALKNTPASGNTLKVTAQLESEVAAASTVTTLSKELNITVNDTSVAQG